MNHTGSLPKERLLHLKDKVGNDIYFSNTEVRMAPLPWVSDFQQLLNNIRDVELRHDDVIIVGYPKSGNNWIHHMVSMLQAGTTELPSRYSGGNLHFIEAYKLPPMDQPRVLYTHLPLRFLPRDVIEKKVKVVLLTRNPKDIFVSLFHHVKIRKLPIGYEGSWAQFFAFIVEHGFWYGDVFDYMKEWQRDIEAHPDLPVFHCNYEDSRRDTLGQVEKLNQVLGYGRSRELCQAIVEMCQLENMAKTRTQSDNNISKTTWLFKDGVSPDSFYRKGVVGDWKNFFTVAQNELFDDAYAAKMAECKRTFDFE